MTAAVYTSDTPQNDPVNILLQKVDAEAGNTALGAATLSDTHFTVHYFDTTDAQSLAKGYTARLSAAGVGGFVRSMDYFQVEI